VRTGLPERHRERFAYLETELFWGDGVTAGQVASTFGLSRQIAQNVIDRYREEHPGQMYYDAKQRRHLPTTSFEPHYIRTTPIAFLDYLRGQALVGLYREDQDWSDLVVTDVDRLLRPELPISTIRTVLTALRRQQAVMIDYRKKDLEPGVVTTRVISPHHLVFADDRYHLRAFCHTKKSYLDFVLSRILHAEIAIDDWISEEYDREWSELVELRLKPNPLLPASVQQAVLRGFEKGEPGSRSIRTRKALLFYIKRRLLATDPKYSEPLWSIESPTVD
jgi:hypothetical protein